MTEDMQYVVSVFLNDWSLEQIAGRLREEGVLPVHHETIYQYVLADKWDGVLFRQQRIKGVQSLSY